MENHNKKAVYHQHISIEFLNPFSKKNICRIAFVLLLIIYGLTVLAQNPNENSSTLLKGQILNLEDEMPVVKATISNQRTKETVTADMEGRFTINALNTDSLEISSLGYSKEIIPIPSDFNIADILIVYARPIRYLLPDVGVKGNSLKLNLKVEDIKISPYFRNDIMREKPAQEKAYQNQISFVKIPLFGKNRPDRETKAVKNADNQWVVVSKIYNMELVRELTGLNATETDRFMMYLNSKRLFDKMITKEYASYIILEQFKQYRKEGH